MNTLNGSPVVVLTSENARVSVGRFVVVRDALDKHGEQLELYFDTEDASYRLRINPQKIPAIKKTWDGTMYQYTLPTGNAAWVKASPRPE